MLKFFIAALVSLPVLAFDLDRAPQSFRHANGKAVYVDFESAHYELTYDLNAKSARVKATIKFEAVEEGYPVFDMRANALTAMLDDEPTLVSDLKTPDGATTVRVLSTIATPGEHTLVITAPLTNLVEFNNGGVHSATWTTDLNDRGYLEQYMPANMEFDRVPMVFDVKFVGLTKKQVVYANGDIKELKNNHFQVTFPDYFTSSSVFFHTVPEGVMAETRFDFRSIDGRMLPVVIYLKPGFLSNPTSSLERLKNDTVRIMNELEADYGPFLHPSLTIYNAGMGGMEYCGATMTSLSALGHELIHSYFARGIIPANGNSGWIDEAIASWRDNGYPRGSGFSGNANMAGRAAYTRFTDRQAYSYGATFMSNLDNLFSSQGGLKSLLRRLVEEKAFTPFFTEDFVAWAEGHYRTSLMEIFKRHVYQGVSDTSKMSVAPHVHHQKLTLEQLKALL